MVEATLLSALAALCLAAAVTIFAATAIAACQNESLREAQTSEALPNGTTYLPSCMALEMVSPPKKFGQEAAQVSAFTADGNRALFKSKAALAGTEGQQAFTGDRYIATRGATGWILSPTSPPREFRIVGGAGAPAGGPYAFAPGLGEWALVGCTQSQRTAGEAQIFTGGLGGAFEELSPLLEPIDDSGAKDLFNFCTSLFPSGTAADLSATVFPINKPSSAYFPEDPRGNEDPNSYVAFRDAGGEPSVELLARDKDGKVWGGRCGARLGGGGPIQGSMSFDGSRLYFTTRPGQPYPDPPVLDPFDAPPCDTDNELRILERLETPSGPTITEILPRGPPEGDDRYQGASLDGSKVFVATPRKLTASDQDASAQECSGTVGQSLGCDLYLYDADLPEGERLIQASAGGSGDPDPGKGADVLSSITALSPDGSHVYFAAQGSSPPIPTRSGPPPWRASPISIYMSAAPPIPRAEPPSSGPWTQAIRAGCGAPAPSSEAPTPSPYSARAAATATSSSSSPKPR